MAGGTTNAFELVFGVKGVGVGGESYEEIRKGIETIAKNLVGKQELNLKFGVDAAALETSIKNALKGKTFNVDVAANVSRVASQAASAASAQGATPAAASNASAAASATTKAITKHIASAKAEVIKLNQAIAGTSKGTQKYAELTAQLAQAEERYKNLVAQAQKFLSTQGAADVTKAVDASKAVTNAQNKQNMAIAVAQDEYNALIQKAQEYMATANQLKTSGALPKDGATPVGDKYVTAVGNFISQYKESLDQSKFSATSYGDQIEWLKKLYASWQEVLKAKRDYENESLGKAKIISKVEDEIAKLQKAGYAPGTSGRDYIGELQQIKSDALDGTKRIKDLNRSFLEIKGSITSTKADVETFGHAMQRAFSEKFKYLIASMGIMYLRRSIRDLINNVKELDAAMTQIEIVTGESSAALERFGKQAAKTAKEVGASVTDIIKSTETYARLGYTLDESLNLADVTAKYSNVAATDTESATSALTSIMKAFNYEPEQMEGVVDMLVKVGQEYAISAGELGDALQRGGAALAVGGASLEETIAIMTAGNAAVQNADTVGNALKSVSARIRTSTAELEEMGEEVDDLVSSSSKYRKEILALSGVDIMKNDSTYKSVYQILTEIASVYDKLDDTSKARLLEDLGGKRNATVIGSIISNLDDLKGSYEAATNAAGTLAEANAIYLDSIEGKTKQLKSSWQTLSASILDNEFVKVFVDIARLVLDLFNKLDDATNGWSSTILTTYIGLNLVIAAFKTLSGMSFFQNFGTLVAGSFAKAAAEATAFASTLPGVSAGIAGVGISLQAAFGWAAIAVGAIALVVNGIKAYKDAHPSMEQLKADFEEASNKAEELKEKQSSVSDKIDEIHRRQAAGERTTEMEEELGILSAQNEALTAQVKLYEDLAAVKQAEIDKRKSEAAERFFNPEGPKTVKQQGEDVVVGDLQGIDKVQQQIELYKNLSRQITEATTEEERERLQAQLTNVEQWLADELDVIRGFIDDPTYGKEASNLVSLISAVILGGIDNTAKEAENKSVDAANEIVPKTVDTVKKQMSVMEDAADEYAKYGGLTSDTIDDLKANIPGLVDALYDQNGELTEAGKAALKSDSALRTFAEDALKAATKVNGMSLSEAKQKLKELETAAYSAAYSFTVAGKTMTVALDPQEKRARMEQIDALKKEIAQAEKEIEDTVNGWSKYNPDAGKSGSKKDTFKEGLENRLKILKHQLEMERITQEQYYAGVASVRSEYQANAWRDEYGYEEEITDLEEELFSGRLSILDDFVNDYEHEIEKLTDNGKIGQAQALYVATLARIDQEMQWAIDNGLDRNGDFMQKLEQQWRDTASKITEITKSMFDEYESYADDFNLWGKKGFSKNDFYDTELSQLEEMYKKGYYTSAEYLDRYNEIQKKRFDFHNESLNEIIDLTIEMIEKEVDEVTDAIDEEIDAYDELIKKKKELLQNAEDEVDYEEEVAEAVKEIAKLQSKISQLSLDNSREAAARRAELEERLAEKQKELSKTQRDHALEQTNEALDDSLDSFKEEKEAEKKVAEESIDTWMEKYEKAIDMLDSDWNGTYKKLTKYVETYATSIDGPNSLKTSWEAVNDVVREYGSLVEAAAGIRNGENYGKNPSEIYTTDINGKPTIGAPQVYLVGRDGKSPPEAKNGDYVVTGGGIFIKGANVQPLPLTPYIGKATTGDYADVQKAYEEFKKRGIPTFHSGGIVGDGIKVGDKEVMTLLEDGEWVLDGKRQNTIKEILAQIGQVATYATALKAISMRSAGYPQVGNSFAPHVEVNIQHSGSMSDEDAKHYGDVAADAALEKLRIAFNRRGL